MKNQGLSNIYLRGDIFWIKYHKDGKPRSSSSARYGSTGMP
jgi:hypothetical protein